MKQYLIPENGQFYKANMHTHTTVSDGSHSPEDTKAYYMARGYSVMAFTDHDVMVDHSDLNEEGKFLAITSHEVETSAPAPHGFGMATPTYHLNFYAKNPTRPITPAPIPPTPGATPALTPRSRTTTRAIISAATRWRVRTR